MLDQINENHKIKNPKTFRVRDQLSKLEEEHKIKISSLKKVRRVSMHPEVYSPR